MSRFATPTDLVPEAHVALGTFLRPFSLGHHLLFERCGLPFCDEPKVFPTPEQLALGVFICAVPYMQGLEAIVRGDWEGEFKRWCRKLRPWFQPRRFIHDTEAVKFATYLVDGYKRAPVMRHGGGGIRLTSPWETLLVCRLATGGFDPERVLEMYLPAAWYHYHTLYEVLQADNCADISKWRKVFWTAADAAAYAASGARSVPAEPEKN